MRINLIQWALIQTKIYKILNIITNIVKMSVIIGLVGFKRLVIDI